MTTTMDADLFCVHCNADRPHRVVYVGDYLTRVECTVCGKRVEINRNRLLKLYAADFLERVLTKPQRMTQEFEGDLRHFVLSLPGRILTKPGRVLGEFRDVVRKD